MLSDKVVLKKLELNIKSNMDLIEKYKAKLRTGQSSGRLCDEKIKRYQKYIADLEDTIIRDFDLRKVYLARCKKIFNKIETKGR